MRIDVLRRCFARHRARCAETKVQALLEQIRASYPLTQDEALIQAGSLKLLVLVEQLKVLLADIAPFLPAQHTLAQTLRNPYSGVLVGQHLEYAFAVCAPWRSKVSHQASRALGPQIRNATVRVLHRGNLILDRSWHQLFSTTHKRKKKQKRKSLLLRIHHRKIARY